MSSDERQLSLFGTSLKWRWPDWFGEKQSQGMQLYDRRLLLAVLSLIAFGFVMVMSLLCRKPRA